MPPVWPLHLPSRAPLDLGLARDWLGAFGPLAFPDFGRFAPDRFRPGRQVSLPRECSTTELRQHIPSFRYPGCYPEAFISNSSPCNRYANPAWIILLPMECSTTELRQLFLGTQRGKLARVRDGTRANRDEFVGHCHNARGRASRRSRMPRRTGNCRMHGPSKRTRLPWGPADPDLVPKANRIAP